jgi:hypothetical protein
VGKAVRARIVRAYNILRALEQEIWSRAWTRSAVAVMSADIVVLLIDCCSIAVNQTKREAESEFSALGRTSR